MSPFLITYIVGVAVTILGSLVYMSNLWVHSYDLRPSVRGLFMSPIWPIVAPVALFRVAMWAFNINTPRFRKMYRV